MNISIKNAFANNLKNIDVMIPVGKITALTGVSGSGKSTLLKDVLYAYGARNLTRTSIKTIKKALAIDRTPGVEKISNLQVPMLIDVKNSVSNSNSTLSTISGITDLLRSAFVDSGKIRCSACGSIIIRDYDSIEHYIVDLEINEHFDEALSKIEKHGSIDDIAYFDKNYKATREKTKQLYATIKFKLNKVGEQFILEFNKAFGCDIKVVSKNTGNTYEFRTEIECNRCFSLNPTLLRNRMSFITDYRKGGGACRCCSGKGKIYHLNLDAFFGDDSSSLLDGASKYINEKGLKYTTVTEKFLMALFKTHNVDIKTRVKDFPSDFFNVLMYGSDQTISFRDRIGGSKKLCFRGIANYLQEIHLEGKVSELFEEHTCDSCKGTRFDIATNSLTLSDTTLTTFMLMSLDELNCWCRQNIEAVSDTCKVYIKGILDYTNNYHQLSCGHLALYRATNTLSGGELQRIRIGTLLSSKVRGVCYLLDEPSSGLHYFDIEKMINLLREVCDCGNTVILVEHNKMVISLCDHIVDLGPAGGINGGEVLFSLPIDKITEGATLTTKMLSEDSVVMPLEHVSKSEDIVYIDLKNVCDNNLKNISVRIPRDSYSVICGVSGSGKTTLARDVLFKRIQEADHHFGFDDVDYLAQAEKHVSSSSTISSVLDIGKLISTIYSKASNNAIDKSCFLLSAKKGKCKYCNGIGYMLTPEGEPIGECEACNGMGFDKDVSSVKVSGLSIFEFYNKSINELKDFFIDQRLLDIFELASKVGVDYLSFSRTTKSLSKGELQRIYLMKTLLKKTENHMIILDEPSRGLPASDKYKLASILLELANKGNTIVAVEHDPDMIRNSNYIIELGGTGVEGGVLLFQGKTSDIVKADTPISKVLNGFELTRGTFVHSEVRKIQIRNSVQNLEFMPNAVYRCSEDKDIIAESADKNLREFLSIAIPGNIMFSRNGNIDLVAEAPLTQTVDFGKGIKVDDTVAEILDLRRLICDEVLRETGNDINKYVFDQGSPTGKCSCCNGEGRVWTVDEGLFIQNSALSTSCKKFLRNRSDYKLICQAFKSRDIDLTHNVLDVSKKDSLYLFWGEDNTYDSDELSFQWSGLIPLFILNHSHYPDSESDKAFRNKKKIVCPLCNGKRLKPAYSDLKCDGIAYSEMMSLPVCKLLNKLNDNGSQYIVELIKRLEWINRFGLGANPIGIKLSELDSKDAAMIKLISLYFDGILDLGIIIKSFATLDEEKRAMADSIINLLTKTNTVWVVS